MKTQFILLFSLLIWGCGQNSKLRGFPGGSVVAEVVPEDVDDFVEEQIKTCEEAILAGQLQEIEIPVVFEETSGCEYGVKGNLEKRDLFFQARLEQNKSINFGRELSEVCDLEINSVANQDMRYDDEIILTLGKGNVLAQTFDVPVGPTGTPAQVDEFGIRQYDWDGEFGIKGVPTGFFGSNGFHCLKDSTCNIPNTETNGAISLSLNKVSVYTILGKELLSDPNTKSLDFSWITTGDNNNDCEHLEHRFMVKAQVIANPQVKNNSSLITQNE